MYRRAQLDIENHPYKQEQDSEIHISISKSLFRFKQNGEWSVSNLNTQLRLEPEISPDLGACFFS